MKQLITHISPHLDDIAAIWLFKKFEPEFSDAEVDFISASLGNKSAEESKDRVFIGVGRGRFDEHKGDLEDSATSLVWKYLKGNSFIKVDEINMVALEELVNWIRLDDLGRPKRDYDEFSLPSFIRPKDGGRGASLKSVEVGGWILDKILEVFKNKHQAKKDWEYRVEFESKFGKAYAIKSSAVDREFCKKQDGDLYLMVDPFNGSVQYFTPSFDIDLEPIYQKVKSQDKDADWFLHQSHHMVICGSGSAPDSKKTKLSIEQLIEAAKNT